MTDIVASLDHYKKYQQAREDISYHKYCIKASEKVLADLILYQDVSDIVDKLLYHDAKLAEAKAVPATPPVVAFTHG